MRVHSQYTKSTRQSTVLRPPPSPCPNPPQSTRRVRSGVRTEYMRNMYCKSAHRVHAKYMLSTLAVRAEYTRSTCRVHELYSVLALRPRVRRRRLRLLRLIRARLLLLIPPIDTSRGGRNHFSSCFSLSSLGYLATLALLLYCGMGEREGVGEVCYL